MLKKNIPPLQATAIILTAILMMAFTSNAGQQENYETVLSRKISELPSSTSWVQADTNIFVNSPILYNDHQYWVPFALNPDTTALTYEIAVNIFDCADQSSAVASYALVSAENKSILELNIFPADGLVWYKLRQGSRGWYYLSILCKWDASEREL